MIYTNAKNVFTQIGEMVESHYITLKTSSTRKKRIIGHIEFKMMGHSKEIKLNMSINTIQFPIVAKRMDDMHKEIISVINKYYTMEEIRQTCRKGASQFPRHKKLPRTIKIALCPSCNDTPEGRNYCLDKWHEDDDGK